MATLIQNWIQHKKRSYTTVRFWQVIPSCSCPGFSWICHNNSFNDCCFYFFPCSSDSMELQLWISMSGLYNTANIILPLQLFFVFWFLHIYNIEVLHWLIQNMGIFFFFLPHLSVLNMCYIIWNTIKITH